jgi:hypothetical protein
MSEDKTEVAQIKLLEIAKHAQGLKYSLQANYRSAEEMTFILTPLCAEPGIFDKWRQKLTVISRVGVLNLRVANPSQAKALNLDADNCPDVDVLNQYEPWLIPGVHEDFVGDCLKQFNLTLNALDPITRVGGFSINRDEDKASDRFELYNPDVFISWHGVGTKATLKGAIKSGKTNAGLWLSEQFLAKKIDVASNITVRKAPNGYNYCPKLSALLTTACESNMKHHELNITFDEANLFWHKTDTVRPRNVDLSKLALCFGKMHASLLFISHYQSIIPTVIAQTAVAEFQKLSKRTMLVDVRQGKELHLRTITDWPATTLEYDPDQLQWFSLDMDIERLFTFMANLKEGEEQWPAVVEYVEKHKDEMADEDLDPRMIAEWLRRNRNLSVPDIADIIGRPERTVRRWIAGLGD